MLPWIYCGAGTVFCLAGLYLFYKDAYEEKKIVWPLLLMTAGVILIGVGTYIFFETA